MEKNQSTPGNNPLDAIDPSKFFPDNIYSKTEHSITEQFYRYTIDVCAEKKLDVVIANRNTEHATYLFIKFFQKALHEVCIYTGSLFDGIFDREDVIKAAIEYLDRQPGSKICIAYQDDKVEPSVILRRLFVRSIRKHIGIEPERLEIWDARKANKQDHFSVMDQSAYRHETDPVRRTALANFGNADAAATFYHDFSSITKVSTKIPVPAPS